MFEMMYISSIVECMIIALVGMGIVALAIHMDDKHNHRV